MPDEYNDTLRDAELAAIEREMRASLPAYLADLAALVNVDCGSYTKAGVDRVGRWAGAFLERLGAEVAYLPQEQLGDVVVGSFGAGAGSVGAANATDEAPAARTAPAAPTALAAPAERHASGLARPIRILCIGHLDTVFEEGTVVKRPFRIEEGRAFGPGVSDMKAGLLVGLYALQTLVTLVRRGELAAGLDPLAALTFVANPDEEIGSPVSTPPIEAIARTSDVAFVLEGARANGDIVSRRKSLVDLRLQVTGRAAHAGVEPEKGRNAVVEAAHLAVRLHALNGRWEGVTCNVGVLRGGTRPNIVPDAAELEIDLRAPTRVALEAAEAALREACAAPTLPDVRVRVEERARHWPMEKLAGTERLVEHVQSLAARLGFQVADAATGGASDANTTAGLGVPTLDGLGPIGGLDHAPGEYVEVDSIVPRATLFAALLARVARDARLVRGG